MSRIIIEEAYQFKGFGGCESECRLTILGTPDKTVVVLSQLKNSKGTSVTNAIEILRDSVMNDYLFDSNTAVWYEHYGYGVGANKKNSRITLVTFDENNIPMWCKSISSDEFKKLYDYDLDI